jgi:(1->4)-alpha-D-glucan 1-alpha-D-glucosylmutase
VSGELGGEHGLRALAQAAHDAGMGVVLDFVPNHMATGEANRFWADSRLRERFFDIDPATGLHRRFFDVDDLAGVRQEDPEVFQQTHELVLRLVGEGVADGLRIDHPDGLADPAAYFARLRAAGVRHVWIEKILEPDERLRDWGVTGTVGYEFLNDVCALFVDSDARDRFSDLWRRVSGDKRGYGTFALEAKLEQATTTFKPEVERLARLGPPLSHEQLARGLAALSVYRTYIVAGRPPAREDRAVLAGGPADVGELLLGRRPAPPEFVTRYQQTTPAIVGKGVEDTAFYRYGRLLALCEVGGDPDRFGISVQTFHQANAERADRFPLGMLATSTHDTKRSADVRARIAALTWIPGDWERHVRRWLAITEPLRSAVGSPDDAERYFLFQTLVGAWPIEPDRIEEYMRKALREAKRNSNWIEPRVEWEEGVLGFCRALYCDREFLADFEPFAAEVARHGERIALGMLTLKLTAPGMPDIYQGDELAFRALVDPDNRRPVDWEWRRAMLARLQGGSPPVPETRKLWLTMRLLGLRIRRPDAFSGAYGPLDAGDDTVAFTRGDQVLVAVATRPDVGGVALRGGAGRWRDLLTGDRRALTGETEVRRLLDDYGIAVLERD